ncbi:MAG: hypothetical protein PQJ49_12520 [Sphaerochaetaceae bacterium]|nr:hypothetical protein [Sphaerochaetaceae bacterium]
MTNIFEAKAHLQILAQESQSSEGYEASTYLYKFIEDSRKKQELTKEYYQLVIEYSQRVVNIVFTSGLTGYIDSRIKGNYSLEAIKQTLNNLKQ